jgi:hypothetical protein
LALADKKRDVPIHAIEGGLSDVDGEMELYHSSLMGQSLFAGPHYADGAIRAKLQRGDDWLGSLSVERVDIMVLDVERWEKHALAGLTDTIARSADMVALVERSSWAPKDGRSSPTELLGFFRDRFEVRWAKDRSRAFPCDVWGPIVESDNEALKTDIPCIGPQRPLAPAPSTTNGMVEGT